VVIDTRVFWLDRGDPDLGSANGTLSVWDGSVATLAGSEPAPQQLVADDSYLYWTRYGTKAAGYTDGAVVRARHDGSELTTLASDDIRCTALLQDATFLYIATLARLLRIRKDGSGALEVLTFSPDAGGGSADFDFDELATDGKHLYWANYVLGYLLRMPVAGGASEIVAEGQVTPKLVALDQKNAYFAVASAISRAAK
jgi:hypothetical protein